MAETKGVWLDTESNKIVRDEPAQGRLIANPGEEITPAVQATIDLYEANYAPGDAEPEKPVRARAAK